MFGFLPAPCGCFSRDEQSVYRAHFCGLCNALRHRYGLWSRLLANRDAAFLSLLGSALGSTEPAVTCATCCNPLAKPRSLVQTAAHVDYAAAVTVCGLVVKLEDDADDESGLRRHLAGIGHAALRNSMIKAVTVLEGTGFPVGETLEHLRNQRSLELQHDVSPTDAARQTRLAYGNIFSHLQTVSGAHRDMAKPLRELGGHLGELIYIADAWDDHASDRMRGRFNPLPDHPDMRREVVAHISESCIGGITTAFNALHLHGMMPLTKQLLLFTMPNATKRRFLLSSSSSPEQGPSKKRQEEEAVSQEKWRCCDACDCCDCDPGCCDCHGCDCPCDGCDCSCH